MNDTPDARLEMERASHAATVYGLLTVLLTVAMRGFSQWWMLVFPIAGLVLTTRQARKAIRMQRALGIGWLGRSLRQPDSKR